MGETTKGGKGPERIEQCFEILGLKAGASQEELTQAYRDLVNVWHPDRFNNNPRLQEKAQEKIGVTPSYNVLKEWGPDHEKTFIVGVYLGDKLLAEGEGSSKQEAESEAARKALEIKNW